MKYSFGRSRITDLLREKGWTQQDLANHSGHTKQTVSFYATSKSSRRKRMPLDIAVSFAEALGCSERDLFEWVKKDE